MDRKEYARLYRQEHAAEIRAYNRQYNIDHPEKGREQRQRFRARHPEKFPGPRAAQSPRTPTPRTPRISKVTDWKEYFRMYQRKYRQSHPEVIAAQYERFKSKRLEFNRRYQQKFPEKIKARMAVCGAVRGGKLVRPSACDTCGKQAKVHGHHHMGYAKENWLNVKWLCKACHFILHRK